MNSFLESFKGQHQKLMTAQAEANRVNTIAQHQLSLTETKLRLGREQQDQLKIQVENLRLAAAFLQNMIDAISTKNIQRVEELTNNALRTVFVDMDLQIKLISEVKRNLNCYKIVFYENGSEGTIHSFGGGVIAFTAIVLKILFNILAKRYPFIVLDESLAFLSEKYIPAASEFLKGMTKAPPDGFGLPILLVTHQKLFESAADRVYKIEKIGERTVRFNRVENGT